jgi:hypothetical protein
MKLPNFKRLFKADYAQEFHSLIEPLSFSLNNGIEVLYQTLNKGVSLKDNVACTVKDVLIEVDEAGVPRTKTVLFLDSGNRILGISVLNALHIKNPTITPIYGVFIGFSQENKSVTINYVKGLPPNERFNITLVAFEA